MATTQFNGGQWSNIKKVLGFNSISPATTKGDLITSDNTNNVRLPVGANLQILTPDSVQNEGIKWTDFTLSDFVNFERELFFYDDFIVNTTAGSTALLTTVSGFGAAVALDNTKATNAHHGILRLTTGTTATGRASINTTTTLSQIFFSGGQVAFQTSIFIPTLSNATQRYSLRIGFGDNVAAGNFVDGVYIEYDDSLSANWQYATSSNSTRTKNNSTVTVATGWNELKIIVNSTGTNADFYINNTLLGSITTNIVTTLVRATGVVIKIEKSVGTTASLIYCDYLAFNKKFSTLR